MTQFKPPKTWVHLKKKIFYLSSCSQRETTNHATRPTCCPVSPEDVQTHPATAELKVGPLRPPPLGLAGGAEASGESPPLTPPGLRPPGGLTARPLGPASSRPRWASRELCPVRSASPGQAVQLSPGASLRDRLPVFMASAAPRAGRTGGSCVGL